MNAQWSITHALDHLRQAQEALDRADWQPRHVKDVWLEQHVFALERHIENARGRACTALETVRGLDRAARVGARERVLLVPTGEPNTYRVPDEHEGLPITRALGRCCSGDTLVTDHPSPSCLLEQRLSDGKPYWVCVHF
jgi:hypothetical protein